jgi:hypothetical protein
VFLALIFVGYSQSKERTVRRPRLVLLPAAMLCLSLYSVGSSFGFAVLPFAVWVAGFLAIVAVVLHLPAPLGVTYFPDSESLRIPGSWLPFALMMSIFGIKYVIGYSLARGLSFAYETWFVATGSICLGVLAGIFVARAVTLWRCIPRPRSGV